MSRRLLDWDGNSHGLAHFWHENGEADGWAVEMVQEVDGLLDLNKEAQNHCNPYNAARDVRMVARIPLIVIAKWRNELGVDYWNPDHQGAVDRLLASSEYQWLRTDLGNANASVHVAPKLIVPEPGNAPRERVVLAESA
jgi:hypothetical protein